MMKIMKTLTRTAAIAVLTTKIVPAMVIGLMNTAAGLLAARILSLAFAPLSFVLLARPSTAELREPGSSTDPASRK